ncbi:glycine--tRNA ligase beta subunit [Ferrigenium kumadai]|uniref:Glycine--tRNA ligase beta subunit n=1 Tax=Ferrigenium kumadai TaxID=1682490 RepID=A0AAN1W0E2_9PROT|nr:glycine--tRNA ligase subunit beta [Ferrigenium kumadai]BBJ00281.1 glycine--tRNA ligase beta subunit [Ferrigenium kumadai]
MTIAKNNLLVELFVEELPPKSLKKLGDSFAETLAASLKAQGLAAADAAVTAYASPRRLAVHVADVAAQAADKSVSQKLMPVAVGLDANGQATPALLKRLAALGADASVVPQLKRAQDGKAEALFFDSVVKGAHLVEGLQKALEDALAKLPIAKVMTYQLADGWSSVNFVRPAHGLVALHGADIVAISTLGLNAGRTTQGHRFEAANATVVLKDADSYAQQLESEGAVVASFAARRAEIVKQLTAAAAKEGLKPIEDDALLDEVTALVERPNVLLGKFEEAFLEVPQECLILTMKANQKYFPLLDANGKLTNKFLIVSNIRPADASLVVGGNERVVRPRLADAKFFFDQDRKKTLASRVEGLGKVVYHNKLGTQGERVERVRQIALMIGNELGGEALAGQAQQAATLAKADLLTDMVGEFPELQGIMGRYYAQHDGLSDDVSYAIEDHYKPRFAGDELPRNMVGICVSLADKLETLAGLFSIGQVPTGDKDPFALRRHALGVIRILIAKDLPLQLETLLFYAFGFFSEKSVEATNQLTSFIYERLAGLLREQGYTAQEVDAVLSLRPQQLSEVAQRLAAVRAFAALSEAAALAAANKRVGNILKKVEGAVSDKVDVAVLQEAAEQALHQALGEIAPKADAAFAAGDYTASLQALAALRAPVDAFFDNVMVNAEDEKLRTNRLALLAQLQQAMNRVADISKLAA